VGSVTGAVGSVTAPVTTTAIIQSGTAQAGASGSITLATSASTTASLYIGDTVGITAGTGAGQARIITAYSTGRVASVDWTWSVTPDNTSVYNVVASDQPALNSSLQTTYANAAPPTTAAIATATAADILSNPSDLLLTNGSGYVTSTNGGSITVDTGTAQAGAGSTITLRSGSVATNSFYNGETVFLSGGTGVGQTRTIVGYVGSTKVATVNTAWATNPDNTSTYDIFPIELAITDSSGDVTFNNTSIATVTNLTNNHATVYGYNTGEDPATLLLLNPTDLILTNGSGYVTYSNAAPPTTTSIAAAIWGAALATYDSAGTFGRAVQVK
jgi:hypothetical protein